jgi:hypothetical protein
MFGGGNSRSGKRSTTTRPRKSLSTKHKSIWTFSIDTPLTNVEQRQLTLVTGGAKLLAGRKKNF